MTDRDTGNEALRAAFEEWCIRFELNSSSVYVRDQWQAALAVGAADARAEENEACAKIAEASKAKQEAFVDKYASGYNACSIEIAEAIRARQEK